MKRTHILAVPMLALLAMTACATTRESDADKLARYEAFAGPPVASIHYSSAGSRGFDVIDDQHVVLDLRPSEAYILRLNGPCLGYERGSPTLGISSQFGRISAGFDRVTVASQPGMSCIIDEIRPVDLRAMRAAEKASAAQPSGT